MLNQNEQPLSLDTTVPENAPLSVDTANPGNPSPNTQTAEIRAKKARMAVGELLGQSEEEIYSRLMLGEEGQLRAEASARIDARNEQARIQHLIDTVKANGRTLTIEQMDALRRPPSDPKSVFEDNYAKKYLEGLYNAAASIGDTDLDRAIEAVPSVVENSIRDGERYLSNYEYARTWQEKVQQTYDNQGWLPWIVDQGKNLIPFYSDVKLRGWLKNQSRFEGWLQGSNLEDQTRTLLKLKGPAFKEKLDEILNKLSNDNPTLALQYANAVLGMSSNDVIIGNAVNILDLTAVPGLSYAARRVLSGVNTTRVAIQDGIKSANTARPSAASIAEGFGDTATAAVEKATETVVNNIRQVEKGADNAANLNVINDPIRQAKEALPTNFILDKNEIAANPGPLSRELLNRILEQQDVASKSIVETIMNTAKVQRIDIEQAGRLVMTQIKDEVRNQNPGIKNAIADVGDPVYNPFSNTHNFPLRIFNWTAEQFSSEELARKFARQNGIEEFEVMGKPGARYFIPEAAIKRDWESAPRLGSVSYKEGELRVFTDDGAEVATSLKPAPGMVPIEVDAKGGVKFHPTIKTDDDVAKAVVAQQGLGFHLVTWVPLQETQTVLKDLTARLASNKSIASEGGTRAWLNAIFGYARTSDATLSPFEIHQRKTAVYAISNYQKLLQNEMKYVEDVARGRIRIDPVTGEDISDVKSYWASKTPWAKWRASREYDELQRAFEAARDMKNPKTGVPGYFFTNPKEINDFWMTNFNRPASFQQQQAYMAFVRNYENDRVFRSLREYTNKARLGGQQHQITFLDDTGKKWASGYFDAVPKKELPGGDYPVAVFRGGKVSVQMSSKLGSKFKGLAEEIRTGEMVASEIYDPELRPLKTIPGIGNNYVRYVVAPAGDRQTKSLSWDQVNRLSGGHFEYDHEFSVKQAKMMQTKAGSTVIDRYEGDRLFAMGDNAKMLQGFADVLNESMKMLRAKNVKEAKRIFQEGLKGKDGPAMEWKDFYKRTHPTKDENGVIHPPVININEPFHVIRKGSSIIDVDKSLENRYKKYRPNGTSFSTFADGTKSGSLARQYQVGYTQARDAETVMAVRDIGTKGNPIYKYEPARFVDPITTMNRALNRITSSSFMDDMKIAGMENWLREAEPYLKADESEIRAAPFYHFNNAGWNSFKKDADLATKMNLLSNRFKTQQFVGVPSKYDLFTQYTAQKASDWMYDKLGPKGLLVPTWAFNHLTSPISVLKGLAYHTKMGLWAVNQVLTQSMTYATIGAVAPRSAPAGSYAALLHQWSRLAPNMGTLELLDNYATKLNLPGFHGWKPGEWLETKRALDRSGFMNVGGEHALLNTQLQHSYIRSELGEFLDKGQMPFRGADKNVRIGAWYTATKEYKARTGKTIMTDSDWAKVLDRADDLSGNMSRASSSILQSGPLSLTGQFLTYQMHLAEFFWGKRIGETPGERALARLRMGAMYGTLFGAAGVGVTGAPSGEYIRKWATDNGYVVGDDWVKSMAMEGLPALTLAWATGGGDSKKGNWYNVGDRLGAGGFTQLRDLWSDAKLWAFIGGAASSIGYNTFVEGTSGLRRSVASMMTGKVEDEAFPMKADDWLDIVKEVASVNAAWKTSVAIQSGKWLSKGENIQEKDVSTMNAIFMGLTGLNLQEVADNHVISELNKDYQAKQKYALNKFSYEFRRAIIAAEDNDPDNYKQYMTRAFGYLKAFDYPLDKYNSAVAIASKGYEARIDSIREDFYNKTVPAGKEEVRGDAWQRYLKVQDSKQ